MVYQYFIKDHLGNNRILFNQDNLVLQQSSYYPFGMLVTPPTRSYYDYNRYLYNGKELQDDFELDWYDYGARFYDAEVGRWHVVDPMAESYFSQSPYHFSGNNPILFLDLNGMNYDEFEFDSEGNINNVKESETDSFHKVDEKGNRIEGVELKLDKKVVTGEVTLATIGGTKVDYLKVTGDDEATQVFSFLAENTAESSTEVGLTRVGNTSGEDGQNMIGVNTEHVESRTSANSAVFENGYTIRQANHSHPNDNPGSSPGDIANAKRIKEKFPNATFNNYTKTFGFTSYDENTTPGAIYTLPTFEIISPKNE